MDRQRAVVVGRTGGWGMALPICGAPVLADSRRNWLRWVGSLTGLAVRPRKLRTGWLIKILRQ